MYTKTVKLKLPEVSNKKPLFNFISIIQTINTLYTGMQEYILNRKLNKLKKCPILQELIERFRNH